MSFFKKMSRTSKDNLLTYALVIVAFFCGTGLDFYEDYFTLFDWHDGAYLHLYYYGGFAQLGCRYFW